MLTNRLLKKSVLAWDHSFSTYAKIFWAVLTPWYVHIRVRIRGYEMLVFPKISLTYKWMVAILLVCITSLLSIFLYLKFRKCLEENLKSPDAHYKKITLIRGNYYIRLIMFEMVKSFRLQLLCSLYSKHNSQQIIM